MNYVRRRTKELRLKEEAAQRKTASTEDNDLKKKKYVQQQTRDLRLKEERARNASSQTPDSDASNTTDYFQLNKLEEGTQILPGTADFVSNNEEVSLQVMIQIKMHFYYLDLI